MDPLWIVFALVLGLLARQVRLPPLIGFLAAGFALEAFGGEGGAVLDEVKDLGVTLLLFTVGLKLRLKTLLRPEIWGGASLHMLLTIIFFVAVFFVAGGLGWSAFSQVDLKKSLLIAFGLSFTSSVTNCVRFQSVSQSLFDSTRIEIGSTVPMAYDNCTRHHLASLAATIFLATQRAA